MVIDSHAHVILPAGQQLAAMNAAKIDKTVLFTSTVHPETAENLEGLKAELAKLYGILKGDSNPRAERIAAIQQLKTAVAAAPDRLLGFGTIPVGLTEMEISAWIEQYILGNGFCGIGELAIDRGHVFQLEPLFKVATEMNGLPLWVHTFFPLEAADIRELLSLARQWPQIPLIMGHMGGAFWLETIEQARALPNVYLDLSAAFTTMAPAWAIRELPERVLFSSDAPYMDPAAAKTLIEGLVPGAELRELVMGGNVARLLNL